MGILKEVVVLQEITAVQKRQLLEKTKEVVQFGLLTDVDYYRIMDVYAEAVSRQLSQWRGEE